MNQHLDRMTIHLASNENIQKKRTKETIDTHRFVYILFTCDHLTERKKKEKKKTQTNSTFLYSNK